MQFNYLGTKLYTRHCKDLGNKKYTCELFSESKTTKMLEIDKVDNLSNPNTYAALDQYAPHNSYNSLSMDSSPTLDKIVVGVPRTDRVYYFTTNRDGLISASNDVFTGRSQIRESDSAKIGFGYSVSLQREGNLLSIGAPYESYNRSGYFPDRTEMSKKDKSGAVYIINVVNKRRHAYLKSNVPSVNDMFGKAVKMSSDGKSVLILTDSKLFKY